MSNDAEEGEATSIALRNLGNLNHPSLGVRLGLVKQILAFISGNEFAATKPGPLKRLHKALASAFLDYQYDEQSWTNAMIDVYNQSVEVALPFDLGEFIDGFINENQTTIPHKFALPLTRARLVEFCTMFVALRRTSEEQPAWLTSMLSIIGEQCEKLTDQEQETSAAPVPSLRRALLKTRHYVGDMLRKQPALLPVCLAAWYPFAQPSKARGSLCGVVLPYTKQRQPAEYERVKQTMVDVYQKRLLTLTKQHSLSLASNAWVPFIESLTAADWNGKQAKAEGEAPEGEATVEGFEATLVKAMKKAPESGSYVACTLVSKVHASIDMSSFVTQVGAVSVIKMLKSSDATVRTAGLGLVSGLASKCGDLAAFQLLVAQLGEGFIGKGAVGAGGLMTSQGVQKRCVLYALAECGHHASKALGGSAAAVLSVGALGTLQTILDKEVDASIRLQAAHTLGTWLRLGLRSLSTDAPAEVRDKVNAVLTAAKTQIEKAGPNNHLCTAHLLALTVATRSDTGADSAVEMSHLEPFILNGALAIVKDASKKPAAGASSAPSMDAVLALLLLVRTTRTSATALAAFETAKLWTVVSSSTSFLFSSSLVQTLTSLTTSGNSTGGLGSAVIGYVPVTAASVAESAADSLGSAALCAETIRAIVSIVDLVASERASQLGPLFQTSDKAGEEVNQAAKTLCSLMVLPADQDVRAAVCKHVNHLLSALLNEQTNGAPAVMLLKGLWSNLSALSTQQQKHDQERIANFKTVEEGTVAAASSGPAGSTKAPVIPSPARWADAMLACIPSVYSVSNIEDAKTAVKTSGIVPYLVMVAAHPLVSASHRKAAQNWQVVCSRLLAVFGLSATIPEDEDMEAVIAATAQASIGAIEDNNLEVVKMIAALVEEAVLRDVAITRKAAQHAVYLLSDPNQYLSMNKRSLDSVLPELSSTVLHEHILPALVPLLSVEQVKVLTEQDLLAYSDPLASVRAIIAQLQAESDAARAAEAVVTNADRKKTAPRSARRGNFGADSAVVDDEDWAERVRAEKDQKLLQARSEGGAEYEEIKTRVFKQRAEVAKKIDRVLRAVDLWASFAAADVPTARQSLVLLLDRGLLAPLLNAPVVGAATYQYLVRIVNVVVEPECQPFARDICDSLRITESIIPSDSAPSSENGLEAYRQLYQQSGPILRLLQCLLMVLSRAAAEHRGAGGAHGPTRYPVLPGTFLLLYPVLRGILLLPHTMPGTEHTFHLLDSLWPSAEVFTAKPGTALFMAGLSSIRAVQRSVLDVTLRVLSRPQRMDPAADKVFLRVATQLPNTPSHPTLLPAEWEPLVGETGLLSPEMKVRHTVMQAVTVLFRERRVMVLKISPALETLLWVQKFDESEVVSTVAAELWAGREIQLTQEFYVHLRPLLSHPFPHVRSAAARALAGALSVTSSTATVKDVVQSLKDLFNSSLPPKPESSKRGSAMAAPVATGKKGGKGSSALEILSQAGSVLTKRDPADDKQSHLRVAIANVFGAIGAQASLPADVAVESGVVTSLLDFILNTCMVDTHPDVRNASLTAGRTLIDGFGKDLCTPLMHILEGALAAKYTGDSKDEDALQAFDNRNAAAVVLLGATGRHLQKDDPAVGTIAKNLIAALKTPSESVQKAVADCLTPLVQVLKGQEIAVTLLESLIDSVLNGATYGDRKGAALGLSAFVKGLGIPCLKQHDIIPRLKEACANGAVNSRQGALFAFECLSERIGVLFEPYIISIVEVLLKSFSHSSDHVREAAQEAARVIMNKLSAHGVKQVLTPILSSLPNEAAWKSRQESIRLLGMMAHCAPKQLASCLPQVVPALMLAGSDPHPKVKESARAALQDISSVIRNPEVLRLSPVLLGAIGDPANKTREALEALLECEFMHSIDAPSLALLVPILARALRDRGADLKRKSAAITGNMVSMVGDAKILSPYLVQVLPGLQDCLLDPIPDVRATSAKAIGSLFVGMGEEHEELKRMIPWLSTTLSTESSPVERSGAAQGLAEICGSALEPDRVMQVLQTVLRLQTQSTSGREGLLWFLSFLPATLNEGFAVYISITLPVILSGLSDENDGVREVALRAGQVVVYKLGISHTNELIPALTQGMFQEDWRIRHSSVQLLGELLCMVGETKAAGPVGEDDDGDEEFETGNSLSRVSQKIRTHIGDNETNAVLASLYIVRSDVSMSVRQSALAVWKSIVSNSPRTLMEIMPVLVRQLIDKLASPSEMLRSVAGSSLGDIVSKLGDKVLPAVVKPLREGLRSEVVSQREGVCSGLNEIMAACTRKQAEDYIDVLVPALQQALCDPAIEVCSQAARAFLTLFKAVGVKAIHQIVPNLLETYGDGTGVESQLALQGLREIVQQRPRDLLEYLLPSLMVSPVTVTSAKALGSIMEVAGPQLHHYLGTLIPALVLELSSTDARVDQLKASADADGDTSLLDAECVRYEVLKDAAGAVMGAVTSDGVHHLVGELGRQMDHDSSVKRRRWGCWLAGQFFTHSKATYSEYVPVLLKFLLSRVAESDKLLLQAVTEALQALSVAVPAGEFMDHLEFMRSCISSTASAARHRVGPERLLPTASGEIILPLFTVPKSLDPLYTILLHGLMNGSVTAREVAAETIGELALFADVAVLKPLLIKTTGPLIRVVGDRFPSSVKAAILQTLCVLLDKGGASLKAFVPQLQTTFVKALNDPSREVRTRGASALGRLMPLSVRVDPLLTELTALCLKAESTAIKISALDALGTVLLMGGNKATPASLESTKAALMKALVEEDETIRASAAASLARLVWFLEPSAATDALLDLLDSGKGSGGGAEHWTQQCGRLLGLGAVLQGASQQVLDSREEAFLALLSGCRDDRPAVNAAAVSAIAMMLSIPGSGKTASASAVSAVVDARRSDLRSAGQATIHCFASALGSLAQAGASSEIKTKAMVAIKHGAKYFFGAAAQHYKEFLPPLVNSLKEIDLRVKYSAERALKHLCEGTTAAEAAAGVLPGQSALLTAYLQGVSAGNSSASAAEKECVATVRDYMRRVLATLPAESDSEGYD